MRLASGWFWVGKMVLGRFKVLGSFGKVSKGQVRNGGGVLYPTTSG